MYRTLVLWLRLSNQGSRGTNTPAIALLISAVAILSFPSLSHAAEDTELERLTAYWKGEAPWCPSPAIIGDKVVSIEFASKDQHEKTAQGDRVPCNDGDSVMFNGLLCLAGVEADQTDDKADTKAAKPLREVGCNAVKYSQTTTKDSPDYGRWWRSPRRVYLAKQNQQPEGGSESTFSNDHALGVMAYIAATKDVDAFRAWTQWIRDKAGPCQSTSCFLVGLPRYCPDDRCGFKFADCPLLDRLAQYLGVENAACSSDNVKKAQEGAWAKFDLALVPFNAILPQLKAVINKYGAGEPGAHTPERITIYNSIINDQDYPLNDVIVTAYLLRKFGIGNQEEAQMTADIAFLRQKDNAFFDYVAHGPLPQVREQLTNTCGEADDGHPKFQWIWERHDIPGSAKETMYWDCVFLGKTLTKGSYPPLTPLPAFANIAVGIADARNTVHSPCANCNDNCSGHDIDCGKPWPEKGICEIEKSTIITACKAICTSTCWK